MSEVRRPLDRPLPANLYRFTGIRVRNIYPQVAPKLLEVCAARYGRVVHVEAKEREAIITYTDSEAPRRAIADLHDTVVHRVSNFNERLHVRFAPGSNQDKYHMRNVRRMDSDECHFFRTTGCLDAACRGRHVPFNEGIDLQPWMTQRPMSANTFHARREEPRYPVMS